MSINPIEQYLVPLITKNKLCDMTFATQTVKCVRGSGNKKYQDLMK